MASVLRKSKDVKIRSEMDLPSQSTRSQLHSFRFWTPLSEVSQFNKCTILKPSSRQDLFDYGYVRVIGDKCDRFCKRCDCKHYNDRL